MCSRTIDYINITNSTTDTVGVRLFNRIPKHLKLEGNFRVFKSKVKALLIENSICSVDEFILVLGRS